ncbi:multisubunit sodium/proton antiporter, MrpB subunit [Alteribacillus persepolensis]|uniref:Multisubunit sodium/proton antiporter, MrpB subunit n=1 Tax=Alteribacillus persepolensis TaxID=568899 RepID=A0A1G8CMG3_9BACI|nr:Na(+)/H(+) antiporter subunit B [Alteribacillus persepolensis]SDH46489.1 multisubunit sodium/proton antiporter, MrpB subunit [Alteribacillus persepolensis]
MKSNDVILQTATKFVLFIILAFSVYMFFNGHHEPGGGFIGGLMTASALVLLLLAYDIEMVRNILPVDFKLVTAAGLLTAVGTGLGSFLFGVPFLSQTFDYFTFPVLGELELATALLFDVGVYLVVIGVTLTIIQTIGEDQ